MPSLFGNPRDLSFTVLFAVAVISICIPTLVCENTLSHPYIQIVTPSGLPGVAGNGQKIKIYGTNFCSDSACGAAEVLLCQSEACEKTPVIARTRTDKKGAFVVSLVLNVAIPQYYLLTVHQAGMNGASLTAATPLIVPAMDEEIGAAQPRDPHGTSDPPGINEFQPNINNGGRAVAVDVDPSLQRNAVVASESGGLFSTSDNGATWKHIDSLRPFRMTDVSYLPGQALLASTFRDSQVKNGGGIWLSPDGGGSWTKPVGADPSCSPDFSSWEISFVAGTKDVFVGTDCGVAVSHNLAQSFQYVLPDPTRPRVLSVAAQRGTNADILDICAISLSGSAAYYRSTDGGTNFALKSAVPNCPWTHALAISPLDSNVVFRVVAGVALPPSGCPLGKAAALFEGDYSPNGTVAWAQIGSDVCSSRAPWVASHLSSDKQPGHFDLYFGSGLNLYREVCTGPGPGPRCPGAFVQVTNISSDQNGIAFTSDGSNCAIFAVTDHGIHTTPDCGATWGSPIGSGPLGYNALQLYEVTGQIRSGPPSTPSDVYIGTQDNNLWASTDGGSSWPNSDTAEGFYIQTPHSAPVNGNAPVTYVACSGCANKIAGRHFSNPSPLLWNNPQGVGNGNPFLLSPPTPIRPAVIVQWAQTNPPAWQLYKTINFGHTWTQVPGATLNLNLSDGGHIRVVGPSSNPIIYQAVQRLDGTIGLSRIEGVLTSSAVVRSVDSGIGSIAAYCNGEATYRCPVVYAADPNNPDHVIVADQAVGQMMVTRDGGRTWVPDSVLTDLLKQQNQFQFTSPVMLGIGPGSQAHIIAFDPNPNSSRILVGTEAGGIIMSAGSNWTLLPGSGSVTAISDFFFDDPNNQIFVSTYGRGLWMISGVLPPTGCFVWVLDCQHEATMLCDPTPNTLALAVRIANQNPPAPWSAAGVAMPTPGGVVNIIYDGVIVPGGGVRTGINYEFCACTVDTSPSCSTHTSQACADSPQPGCRQCVYPIPASVPDPSGCPGGPPKPPPPPPSKCIKEGCKPLPEGGCLCQ